MITARHFFRFSLSLCLASSLSAIGCAAADEASEDPNAGTSSGATTGSTTEYCPLEDGINVYASTNLGFKNVGKLNNNPSARFTYTGGKIKGVVRVEDSRTVDFTEIQFVDLCLNRTQAQLRPFDGSEEFATIAGKPTGTGANLRSCATAAKDAASSVEPVGVLVDGTEVILARSETAPNLGWARPMPRNGGRLYIKTKMLDGKSTFGITHGTCSQN